MEDVLSVLLYPNTNYLHLLLSEPKKFTRVLFVTFVTNSKLITFLLYKDGAYGAIFQVAFLAMVILRPFRSSLR